MGVSLPSHPRAMSTTLPMQYLNWVSRGTNKRGVRKTPAWTCKDNEPVNVVHRKGLDTIFPQDLLLALVNVAQTNVYDLLCADPVLVPDPAKNVLTLLLGQAREEGHGHAMNVSAVRRLGRVDVSMSVDPDDADLPSQPLSGSLRGAGDGADGNGVITAQSQDEPTLGCMLVDLLTELFVDCATRPRRLHFAMVFVLLGDDVSIVMHLSIEADVELEVVFQLVEQTCFNEGHWCSIDTRFSLQMATTISVQVGGDWDEASHLSTRITDCDDAQLIPLGEELGLERGCVCHDDRTGSAERNLAER